MASWDAEAVGYGFEVDDDRQDELFEVLSHSVRRFTLRYLRGATAPLPLEELTRELVAWRTDGNAAERPEIDTSSVRISLVHNHLPKMAESGFVDYDEEEREVSPGNRTADVAYHLQGLPTGSPP